ncbi:MAG: protein-methionine-sulfoxide reductase catalytic subunit MsrP [Holophagales bacterium]|nr:protein-methionine-sulfoxide reductase catalytic subunit MsrP [Holophagales bacterium]
MWKFAGKFTVEPWKVEVTGLCDNPMTLDLDDIFGFEHEERLYHFRCVERWAMNVPWSGFPLSKLIEKAAPKASAKHVRFFTALKRDEMPGVREAHWYQWPYFEALRLDEAMNELAFVATGIYGEPLVKQHGAPLRLAVPWKYGYKSAKSIVKIEFVAEEPKIFWQIQPHEYGYLSNVNPNIPHPRWSQATSHWLHNSQPFETPIFNGYGEYVAGLYPDEPTTMQRALRTGQVAR